MINFCLLPEDNALSGPSRSKLLNTLTNDIYKVIVIGFEPLIKYMINKFDIYKDELSILNICIKDDYNNNEKLLKKCESTQKEDIIKATKYIERLQHLLIDGITYDELLGNEYDRGYKGLLTALKDSNCKFPLITKSSKHNDNHNTNRPYPIDKNICLSILDMKSNSNIISSQTLNTNLTLNSNININLNEKLTKTKELNIISNCVSRTILYGNKFEKDFLANNIHNNINNNYYINKWNNNFNLNINNNSQEIKYLKSLILLLINGISKTEDEILTKKLRLYDNYLNSFHRVVELCLSEISLRLLNNNNNNNNNLNINNLNNIYIIPQNDDFLLNFVQWEQNFRRNLTADIWRQNPNELSGNWEFVDIKGTGSLSAILLNSNDYLNDINDETNSNTITNSNTNEIDLNVKQLVSLNDLI